VLLKKIFAAAVIAFMLLQMPTAMAMELMSYGSQGQAVYSLQEELANLGYDTGGIDGVFGPCTQNAVVEFQKKYNLSVDGIVGPETMSILERLNTASRGGYRRTSNYKIVDIAKQYVGTPYIYGGTSPSGFDCSGLTSYVYNQIGYNIGRTAEDQFYNGRAVSLSDLQPGDLIFFSTSGGSPTHVAIYLGNNQLMHMSFSAQRACICDFSGWFRENYIGARRYL
jgi:peptidoglycan hydrolase-like protein with peptidoglycan-binding domain